MANKKSIAELINSENIVFSKEQREHQTRLKLLTELESIKVVPVSVNAFGYSAEASANFEGGATQELLALFPPVPCTLATGGSFTMKPTAWLRAGDPHIQTPCHPVTVVHKGKGSGEQYFRWWSEVAGMQVCIENKASEPYNPGDNWEMRTFEYATGWQCMWVPRKLTGKDVPVMGPLAVWQLAWDHFIHENGYIEATARQIKAYAKSLEKVGECARLVVPEFKTAEEQAIFKDFADKQEGTLKLVRADHKETANAVFEWVSEFVRKHGNLESVDRDVLEYLVCKELNTPFCYKHSRYEAPTRLDICFGIEDEFYRQEIEVEANADKANWDKLTAYAVLV